MTADKNGQEHSEQVFDEQEFTGDGADISPEDIVKFLEESGILAAGGFTVSIMDGRPTEAYVQDMIDPVRRASAYMDLLSSRIRVGGWVEEAVKDHYTATGVASFEKLRLTRAIDQTHLAVDDDGKPRINGRNAEVRRAQLREALEFEFTRSENAEQRALKTRRDLEEAQAHLRTVQDAIRISELIDGAVQAAATAQEVEHGLRGGQEGTADAGEGTEAQQGD